MDLYIFVSVFQLVVLGLIAAAAAAPQLHSSQDVQILRYDINNSGLDAYNFV